MRETISPIVFIGIMAIIIFAGYLMYTSVQTEGFEDSSGASVTAAAADAAAEETKENFTDDLAGKSYDAVTTAETPDEEFHLDVGTSFLNAYKKLQPDQIASMTKDTHELIATQKQLMSTLATLKPLITDGKEMLKTFGDYFGADGSTAAI